MWSQYLGSRSPVPELKTLTSLLEHPSRCFQASGEKCKPEDSWSSSVREIKRGRLYGTGKYNAPSGRDSFYSISGCKLGLVARFYFSRQAENYIYFIGNFTIGNFLVNAVNYSKQISQRKDNHRLNICDLCSLFWNGAALRLLGGHVALWESNENHITSHGKFILKITCKLFCI